MRSLRLLVVVAGLAVGIVGCSSFVEADAGQDTEVVTATVHFFTLEGGFYALRTDDTVYDPTNLDPAFKHEGLQVQARVRLRDDLGSVHMVGPMVDILEIHALR